MSTFIYEGLLDDYLCMFYISTGNSTDEPDEPMMPPNDYPHWIENENGGNGHNDSVSLLWNSYLDPGCVKALGVNLSWHCGSIHNLFPYIQVPTFVMENKYDKFQIESSMLMPSNNVTNKTIGYVEYYGNDMDRSVLNRVVDNDGRENGLFYPSCFSHTGGLGVGGKGGYKVNGYNSSELVGDWFWDRNKLPHFVADTCNNANDQLPCNPTCPSYPPN